MDRIVAKKLLRLQKRMLENGDTRNLVEVAAEFERNGPKRLRDLADAIERHASERRGKDRH
jgi:hypothetical protein